MWYTFATPFLFRPLEHGADIVVHSATKFIGGHGTSLGGVIVDGGKFDWKACPDKFPTLAKPDPSYHGAIFADVAGAAAFVTRIRAVILRDTGATLSPFNAFILLQGLETLSLRVERHVENALSVVRFLSNHPKVLKVNHPSLPNHPDHALYQRYFPQWCSQHLYFRGEGWSGSSLEVHRFARNLLASGQCSRCEESGHSSVYHHSLPAFAGGTGSPAHHTFHHSFVNRYRAYCRLVRGYQSSIG